MSVCGKDRSKFALTHFVRFRNGPLFVKSSNCYLAAGFVLPFVVDSAAAT